jgi:hypothetical protein
MAPVPKSTTRTQSREGLAAAASDLFRAIREDDARLARAVLRACGPDVLDVWDDREGATAADACTFVRDVPYDDPVYMQTQERAAVCVVAELARVRPSILTRDPDVTRELLYDAIKFKCFLAHKAAVVAMMRVLARNADPEFVRAATCVRLEDGDDREDGHHMSPLLLAMIEADEDAVRVLHAANPQGADVPAEMRELTSYAVWGRDAWSAARCDALLAVWPDAVNRAVKFWQCPLDRPATPLQSAVAQGFAATARVLLRRGARVEDLTPEERRALEALLGDGGA